MLISVAMRAALLLVVMLAACTTEPTTDRSDDFVSAMRPYAKCMLDNGTAIAPQPEDPYDLMISAKSYCGAKRADAVENIQEIYPRNQWLTQIAIMDQRVEEATVARIVNARRQRG